MNELNNLKICLIKSKREEKGFDFRLKAVQVSPAFSKFATGFLLSRKKKKKRENNVQQVSQELS